MRRSRRWRVVCGVRGRGRAGTSVPYLTTASLDRSERVTQTPCALRQFPWTARSGFRQQIFPSQGRGPAFNQARCYGCHRSPALGGRSQRSRSIVTRFGRNEGGVFSSLGSVGGSLLQGSGSSPECAERVPPEANVVATRMTSSALGSGLIAANRTPARKGAGALPRATEAVCETLLRQSASTRVRRRAPDHSGASGPDGIAGHASTARSRPTSSRQCRDRDSNPDALAGKGF